SVEVVADVDSESQAAIVFAVQNFVAQYQLTPVQLRIESCAPQHVGFGTKTSLVLASLTAAAELSGIQLEPHALQLASRRGGTSGVGVNGYFCGGLVADGGHKKGAPLLPSSAQAPSEIPPILARIAFPDEWRIGLLLPR